MGWIGEIRELLKEIPLLRELAKVPPRLTDLERRISALEKAVARVPGETCGAHSMRLFQAGRMLGPDRDAYRIDIWNCTAGGGCDHSEQRKVKL